MIAPTTLAGNDELVMMTRSAPVWRTMRPTSRRSPSTRRPATAIPALCGSSSRKPTGRTSSSGWRIASLTTARPPSPAPMSKVAAPMSARVRSRRMRGMKRMPAMPRKLSAPSMTMIE